MFSVIVGYTAASAICFIIFGAMSLCIQNRTYDKILHNAGVTESQFVLSFCVFWPISVPLLVLFTLGYAFYSLYKVAISVYNLVKHK